MKIVVIGGTGLIGSKLVPKLREHGHEAIAASPNSGVNTVTGEGLKGALKGASVALDVSNAPSWEDTAVMKFFETSTRNLLASEAAAGVRHHVALSVVGSERMLESGYFRAKIAQENLIKVHPFPINCPRDAVLRILEGHRRFLTDGNKVRLPTALIQPMAADDVATRGRPRREGSPVNGTIEVGGPEQFRLDEFVRQGLAAWKDPREVVADPNARYYGIKLNEKTLVPGENARLGETRFETWLTSARSTKSGGRFQVNRALKQPDCPRLPTHLAHPPKDDRAVAIHALGPSLQGSRQNRGKPCRLFPVDIPGRGSVVVTARRLRTINTRAPFDHVEVKLQNALLAEDEFGHRHQRGLRALAKERSARSEEQVFHQLLRKGGTSANAAAFHIFFGSDLDRVPIEAMVLVEACVLRGDDGVLEIGRDLAERNKFVAFLIRRAVNPGLHAALDVHGGGRWVDPPGGHKEQRGKRPKKQRTR